MTHLGNGFWGNGLWWVLAVTGLLGSALYSGMETGVYSLNRVRLQIRAHRSIPPAMTLQALIKQPATLLSILLIGNNTCNYLGVAALTVIFENRGLGDWQIVAVNVLLITPLMLVFCEVLPKDFFSAHSDRLMDRLTWFLRGSAACFRYTGLLPLIVIFNDQMARRMKLHHEAAPTHAKRQVERLVREGVGYGLLSEEQSAIVERVLDLNTQTVADAMVPWDRVTTLNVNDPQQTVWVLAERTSLSRFPCVDNTGCVLGVIDLYDVLQHDPETCPPLNQLMVKPLSLDAGTPLRKALNLVQHHHVPLAVVTDRDRPVGVATIKDLLEPITGELSAW